MSRAASTTGAPGRRRGDAERNVERILDAAIGLLAVQPTASMAEVARASGLVRATVYGHFPSREALIDAITDRAVADARSAFVEARLGEGTATDAVARLADAAWSVASRYMIVSEATLRTLGVARFRARREVLRTEVRALVARGRAAGEFRDDVLLEWTAQVFDSLLFGTYFTVEAGDLPAADAADELARAFLAVLRP
jgi:AcrR family transcriptional regulator